MSATAPIETAFLPFALRESMQPGDLDLLMDRVAREKRTVTDIIVMALRKELHASLPGAAAQSAIRNPKSEMEVEVAA